MSKTYIFGAGSSVELGYPLGNDFFVKAKELAYGPVENAKSDTARHLLWAFNKVHNGLKLLFPLLPEDCRYWPNFEDLYTFISRELLLPGGPRVKAINNDLLYALRNMIFHTLSECGFEAFLKNLDSLDLYESFIKKILEDEGVQFISFNYDILLTSTLIKCKADQDYGFRCYDITSGKELVPGKVKVVIPHGTINFARCPVCKKIYYSMDSFIASIKNGRANCPQCKFKLDDKHLIAPNYDKDISQEADRIIRFISRSNEIYILGYSFPQYDLDFRNLFVIGLLNNSHNPKITVVNLGSQEELEQRFYFLNLISNSVSYYGCGFLDYIKLFLRPSK